MILRILQVAMFILLVWLTFQFSLLNSQVNTLQHLGQQQQLLLESTLQAADKDNGKQRHEFAELTTQLTKMTQIQQKNTGAEQQLKTLQAKQSKLNDLRKAYILVLEAEAARALNDAKTAQARLAAAKTLIWKAGSHYPAHKKSLQGLMKSIDLTLGAWKRKDLSKHTQAIYSVIAQALKQQEK